MTAGPGSVATGNQLELGLGVPRLPIEPEWKAQTRLWGHSLHPMCSYLASFPAALAHAFIARYSRPGDIVLDPFSGRGTAPLQAAAEGRIGVGNDLNPFAHLLTSAKVETPTVAEARTRATALRLAWAGGAARWLDRAAAIQAAPATGGPEPVPDEVALAFHPRTFAQVLFLRDTLDQGTAGRSIPRRGPRRDPPRQDAVVPLDAHAQHLQHGAALRPGLRCAHGIHVARAGRLRPARRQAHPPVPGPAAARGRHRAPRATRATPGSRATAALRARGLPDRARLVLTSPPYLRVVKYGYYNWLRTWFLGYDSRAIDATLDDAHHRAPVPRVPARRAPRPPTRP